MRLVAGKTFAFGLRGDVGDLEFNCTALVNTL